MTPCLIGWAIVILIIAGFEIALYFCLEKKIKDIIAAHLGVFGLLSVGALLTFAIDLIRSHCFTC